VEFQNKATCPYCSGPLTRRTEGETGKSFEWKVCGFCGVEFGPPWAEHQWADAAAEPDLLYSQQATFAKAAGETA